MKNRHKPVLLQEIINALKPFKSGVYIDSTLGGGGHSIEILKNLDQHSTLVAFDVDPLACENFKKRIASLETKAKVCINNDNFVNLTQIKFDQIQAIIADLGVSTNQYDTVPGLSFQKDEILDMRLDPKLKVKASDLLNGLYRNELMLIFKKYGNVSFARRLADKIIEERKESSIIRTLQLNKIIQSIVPFYLRKGDNKHPEAKVYQALRIAVNDEQNSLSNFLKIGFDKLSSGGKFAVISFHSGEDRIIKDYFNNLKQNGLAKIPVKFIKPSADEIRENNNSRSAKLRMVIKI